MAASNYGINSHGAMSAELMREIKNRALHNALNRSMEPLTDLDTDKRPNLITTANRSGSFVQQRQAALLRKPSLSSSQSSLNSITSDRAGNGNPPTTTDTANGLSRTASINLPRIPSKTLKDRGLVAGSAKTNNSSRHSDVIKRSGEENGDNVSAGLKVRRLHSSGSSSQHRASWSSAVSSSSSSLERRGSEESGPESPRTGMKPFQGVVVDEVVMRRKAGTVQMPLQRRDKINSDASTTPESSAPHSRASSRPTSSASDYNRFKSSAHGSVSRRDSGPSATSRPLSVSSSRPGSGSDKERTTTSAAGEEKSTNHRLSFDNMMGSSTPVNQRHPVVSPRSSSSSSLPPSPPPPLYLPKEDVTYLTNSLDRKVSLPPPPIEEASFSGSLNRKASLPPPPPPLQLKDTSPYGSFESKTSLPLPSPPPTPPASPPPPLDDEEGAKNGNAKQNIQSPLFQPRLPTQLSAEPLPTPPLTPKSGGFDIADVNFHHPTSVNTTPKTTSTTLSLTGLLPIPSLSSQEPSPKIDDVGQSSSDKSSTALELDFLSFLPDELPLDYIGESRGKIKLQNNLPVSTSEERKGSTVMTIAETAMDIPVKDSRAERKVAAPVIHFPPPPAYSPSRSPNYHASFISETTAPLSPAFETGDRSGRMTSTSTDIVMGYLDHTLDPYSPHSASATPNLLLSPTSPGVNSYPASFVGVRSLFTPAEVDNIVIEPLKLQKKKGEKKRKTSTETTKYDGSVKTVRKQIRPGHVGDLRDMFVKDGSTEADEDKYQQQKRARRRIKKDKSGSGDDGDDSGSGYTTTSSDNEYDLELAERLNSLDYSSSSSPFPTPRSKTDYETNWDHGEGDRTPKNASSVESAGITKSAGTRMSVFSFDKDPALEAKEDLRTHQKEPAWKFESVWKQSSSQNEHNEVTPERTVKVRNESAELNGAERKSFTSRKTDSIAPTPTPNDQPHSATASTVPSTSHAVHSGDFVAFLPALELDKTASKTRNGKEAKADTGSVFFASKFKTRSSSSDSDTSSEEKKEAKTNVVNEIAKLSPVKREKSSTGSAGKDSNPAQSGDGSSISIHGARAEADSRQDLIDARYAVNSKHPGLKVTTQGEGDLTTEHKGKGESRLTANCEVTPTASSPLPHTAPTPISTNTPTVTSSYDWLHHGNEEAGRRQKEEGNASQRERDSFMSTAAYSSVLSRPNNTDKDTTRTGGDPGDDNKGLAQKHNGETLTVTNSQYNHVVSPKTKKISSETTSSPAAVSASESEKTVDAKRPPPSSASGSADFFSILNDIHLETETSFSTKTAERARQLYATEDFVKKRSFEGSGSNINFAADAEETKVSVADKQHEDKPTVSASSDKHCVSESSVTWPTHVDNDGDGKVKQHELEKGGNSSDSDNKESSSDSSDEEDKMAAAVGRPTSFTIKRQASGSTSQKAPSSRPASAEVGVSEWHADTRMSAAVGKKSSFTIKRSARTSSMSSQESEVTSDPGNLTNHDETVNDMYVYKDSKGDVYVMQDVTDSSRATSSTAPTSAAFRAVEDDSITTSGVASFDFHGLSSSDSLLVDTDSVDISKAREVIGAFLPRDLENRRGRESMKGESIVSMKGGQQHELSHSLDQHSQNSFDKTAEFEVVSGNVGVKGPKHQSAYYSHHQQQLQQNEVTVSATSSDEVGKQSKVKVNIPRNAVPVLPIPKTRINSVTSSKIPTMVHDPVLSPTFLSPYRPPPQILYDSSSATRREDREDYFSVKREDDFTYASQTAKDRSLFANDSKLNHDRSLRSSKVEKATRARRDSGSSDSSEDGGRAKYKVSSLRREDSDRQEQSYTKSDTHTTARSSGAIPPYYGEGKVYDSAVYAAKQPSSSSSQRVTVTSHANSSFDNDSQYGSQTSRATSGNEPSSPDEHLYRILRQRDVTSISASPNLTSPRSYARESPLSKHHVAYETSGQQARVARDNEQREKWSGDRFSRSEPALGVPYSLNRSFTTLPQTREEEEGRGRFRVVTTSYNGANKGKVRSRAASTSSDSESDSGVEGGRKYRTVSRVTVGGGEMRRTNSTGSLRNAQFSLPPRSPSPPSGQNFRVSSVHREKSWNRIRYPDMPRPALFSLSRVTSDGHLPRDFAHDFELWKSQGAAAEYKRRSWSPRDGEDENNNGPSKAVHTLPSHGMDDGPAVYRSEIAGVAGTASGRPAFKASGSFDEGLWPSSAGERHRTVVNLKVSPGGVAPTTHYTETEGGGKQYRVLQVKPSSYDTGNQSFSPVSGYESDLEQQRIIDRLYAVKSTQSHDQRRDSPFFRDNTPPSPVATDQHYVVNSTRHSSRPSPFVEEERMALREAKPRQVPPSTQRHSNPVTYSSSGQWHKSTIDIKRSPSISSNDSTAMSPLQQQQSKSYVVFNSMDNIRDSSQRKVNDMRTSLPQRSNSQSFDSGDRMYRVMSPTPSDVKQFNKFADDVITTRTNTFESFNNDERVVPPASASDFRSDLYEERTYRMRSTSSLDQGLRVGGILAESSLPTTEEEKDIRVLRGKILIQNRLDDSRDHDDFMDNMNVFDHSFHLGKDNPLYQSDPDLYKTFEEAVRKEEMRSREIGQEVTQDVTWETVDRIAQRHKQGEAAKSSPQASRRKKQNLSTMLLSKLASMDSKDIHQTIDVQHHHEEIYGDVALVHADGSKARNPGTSNFDSVHENVELVLKQGKAFVIIKVIAERLVPIDYEFNVWRKSQAIVTRNIEIDLCANEQRRRLYEHAMETGGRMPGTLETGASQRAHSLETEEERQLSSLETLKLFSKLLDVSEGKGDVENTEMRTRHEMGSLPAPSELGRPSASSTMDLLY